MRPASQADAAAIAGIHIRSWQVAYRGQLPDAYLDRLSEDLARRTSFWERWLAAETASRRQTALVAEEAGRPIGFVTFGPSEDEPPDPTIGEVYAIYVDPTGWGRGYGRALAAMLWVLDTNIRARRFYEVAGWKPDGGLKTETLGDLLLSEVRYRRVFDE
ncbi:MAG: GNAT family N-acetyltransferase [Chloroflexi bacterium]|nr:MAG: GNAT family N-acetyltransferase [Chloroflexota bacterium]